MPKRKKYSKLPNGYGSIKYLGKGRRNPYAVLTAYKSGICVPGMEKELFFP